MANLESFNHQVRRTVITTSAPGAGLVFGIVLLLSSDWIPRGTSSRRHWSGGDHGAQAGSRALRITNRFPLPLAFITQTENWLFGGHRV